MLTVMHHTLVQRVGGTELNAMQPMLPTDHDDLDTYWLSRLQNGAVTPGSTLACVYCLDAL